MSDNYFKKFENKKNEELEQLMGDLEDKSVIKNNNNNINNNTKKEDNQENKQTKKRRPRKNEEDKVKVISISLQNKVLDKVKEEVEEKHSKSISISQFINKVLIDYFKEKGIM